MFKQYSETLAEALKGALSGVEVKATGQAFKMTISKQVPDRDGETVVIAGMETGNYLKNPVVLVDHSYTVESIVGKTLSLTQVGNELVAEFVFADTEDAQIAKQLYEGGFLKSSSIGFIIKARDPQDRSVITNWELLEWSLVAVPCNPLALSLDGKSIERGLALGLIKKSEEVHPETVPTEAEKTLAELAEVKAELAEVKKLLLVLVADGKASDEEAQKALAQKETLQAIARATSSALENVKRLEAMKP